MVDFKYRLLDLMNFYKLSQADLVKKTGWSKGLVSNYLRGTRVPKQDKIYELHQLFNVSLPWLLGFDVPMFDDIETEMKAFRETDKPKPNNKVDYELDFGYSDKETKTLIEKEERENKEDLQNSAINKLEKLTQITSALATMSDEDFEMVYKLAIRLSK